MNVTGIRGMNFNGPNRPGPGRSSQNRPQRATHKENTSMPELTDLIFIGVIVAFFVIAGLYAAFCEKL
jgi:hypothetical protein